MRLNLSSLGAIQRRLSTHHSKDASLISRISKEIMATYEPWRCKYCKKISKASANGCSQCLTPWQECQDTEYVPPTRQQDWNWKYHQESGQSPRSPRNGKGNRGKSQQPKSPRHGHKGRGKGGGYKAGKGDGSHQQGKQTGKGKVPSQNMDKGKGKGETMVPPEPPWTPTLHPSSLPLPPPTTPPPPPSAEETTLKELIHALKKSQQDMDPEVQAILQRSHMKEGQKSTQSLYSAVDDLSTARETLDIAKLARHNLHIKWRNFLTDAVQRWQKHTEDFQREESELTQQIEAAKTSLAAAVRRFENSKSELGVQVIDVEAQAAMEEAAADGSEGVTVGTALFDSLVTMRSQLETVQASAEAMVTEEANSSNKRQRVEEGFVQSAPLSGGGMPSPSAPAMQAFPKREPKENQDSHFPPPDKS